MKQIKVHHFLLLVMAVFTFSSAISKTLDSNFDNVNWQADIDDFQKRGLITAEEHQMLVHYIELPTTSANVNVPYRTVLLHAEREKQDEKQAQLAEGRYVQISHIQVVYDEYLNPFIFIEITNLTDKDIEIRYVVRQFWSEFDTYITRETIFYEVNIASRDRITKFESAGFDNTTRSAVLEVRIIEIYFDGEYFGIPGQRQLLSYVPNPYGRPLNDIRFGDWEEEDWYDNDYFRFMRTQFDGVYNGTITISDLERFRPLLNSKFTVSWVQEARNGLYIQFIFIDHPNKIFSAVVNSEIDMETETITGYSFCFVGWNGIQLLTEESGFTREDILEILRKYPMNRLW